MVNREALAFDWSIRSASGGNWNSPCPMPVAPPQGNYCPALGREVRGPRP
jgi:hypothetical protein